MNLKKPALIGILALVVIGCVLAAGCTSTGTEPASAEDQIIGSWINEDGSTAFIITEGGNGTYYKVVDNEIVKDSPLVWTKNSDGTYAFTNPERGATVKVTLDAVKGTFTSESGFTFIKRASDASGELITDLANKYVNLGKI